MVGRQHVISSHCQAHAQHVSSVLDDHVSGNVHKMVGRQQVISSHCQSPHTQHVSDVLDDHYKQILCFIEPRSDQLTDHYVLENL